MGLVGLVVNPTVPQGGMSLWFHSLGISYQGMTGLGLVRMMGTEVGPSLMLGLLAALCPPLRRPDHMLR